jgi:two-component system, chemotaxis family, CheB/CheR fusion protein
LSQKKSGTKTSRSRPRAPSKEGSASPPKPAIAAPEEIASKSERALSNESAEQVPAVVSELPERSPSRPFPIVGIGASAGGLEAFTSFLKALPADTGMAFVLVQHMDPAHESLLNRLLEKDTAMPVIQVRDGMVVKANHVYVIPPNTEMTIHESRLRLAARAGGEIRHTPIDTFLHALAEDQQSTAIGVILSGIGSDGTQGLKSIKAEGGITFAQDEDSAKFPGMPMSAEAAGCVDLVLPPDKIALELARMRRHPYLGIARSPITEELPPGANGSLRKIFHLMRSATGVDFTHYKQATIQRRISRRMLVRRCETLAQYVKYVQEHSDELNALFQDVLIHVTSFFREPQVYKTLHNTILPRILECLAAGEPVRIWVPGCSSGEEVYSTAIALHEYFSETARQTGIQIFGTDISDSNIQKARAAIYSQASTEGMSPERLRRFFVKAEGGHQVAKPIREMCVFARHDLTRDPPFSRMDLISCRNVLIYLTPVLQKKVLEFFHYALKPGGFLVLGKSEGVSGAANLFSMEDRKANVYSKKQAPGQSLPAFRREEYEKTLMPLPSGARQAPPFDLRKEADRIILERYAPPGLVVDADLHIINFQGDTSPFLRPAPGEASFDILKLVRPELILETRAAIQEAKKLGTAAHREGIPFKRNGQIHRTDLEVVPIPGRSPRGVDFLVLFQNQRSDVAAKRRSPSARQSGKKAEASEADSLRQQLASMQNHLRSLMEDHEAAAEELRAANEEVLSSNEELQSTNEELQTAKEELQSSNEELTTLNEELQHRNVELAQTATDLNSLLNAIEIPIVILGKDRRIRRFTQVGEQLLNLIPSDVGRPINQIRPNLDWPNMEQMASQVIERGASVECEVRDQKGHWYALRMRPYQTVENRVEGILVVLVDIHDVKEYSTAIVETLRGCLLVLDHRFGVLVASPGFYRTFEVKSEETESKILWEIGNGQWNVPPLRELLEKVLPEKKEVVDFEVEHDFPAIGHKILLLSARQLHQAGIGSPKILLVIEDITERKLAEKRIRQLLARLMTDTEEEGKRIARELHDSFGPRLATLNLRVSEAEGRLSGQPDLAGELEEIRNEISDLAKISHDLSHELHPAALAQLGIGPALEAECATFSKLHRIAVNFSAEGVPESLPDAVALCLYRVAQESLENIRKHAQAKMALVSLAGKGAEIVMVIQDLGRGFDFDAARRSGGLGLVSIEERVRLVKGSVSVTSKPGEGTRKEVRIPLGRI